MRMNTKKLLFLLVSSLYALYIFIPLILGVTGVTINLISIVVTVLLVILNPKALYNKTFLWFCVYVIVLLLYLMVGKVLSLPGVMYMSEINKLITEIAMILPSILIFFGLIYHKDLKLIKNIAITSLLATLFTFVLLIPLIIVDSNILRFSLASDFRDIYKWMPTYPAMHSYVIVLPALLYVVKYAKGWFKFAFIASTTLYVYIIFNTSITTSLLIAMLILGFFFLYKNNLQKTGLIIGLVVLLIFFLHVSNLLIHVFDFGLTITEDTYSVGKFEGFRDSYLTGIKSSSMAIRDDLHNISFRSFLRNPIWGGNIEKIDLTLDASDVVASSNSVIGGHSSLIDRLGGMGLLGFIPFIMIIITSIKTWKTFFHSRNAWYFYCVGLGAAGILLYTKGLFGQEGWFTMIVYLPALILFGSNYISKKLEKRV